MNTAIFDGSDPTWPEWYPNLQHAGFQVTSPPDHRYNCVAWTAAVTNLTWWPLQRPFGYWPEGVPEEESVEAFITAFGTLGFAVCESPTLNPGFEKIAIHALGGVPEHTARQLPTGLWTSKMGKGEDIEHTLEGLEGPKYGRVAAILKRPSRKPCSA